MSSPLSSVTPSPAADEEPAQVQARTHLRGRDPVSKRAITGPGLPLFSSSPPPVTPPYIPQEASDSPGVHRLSPTATVSPNSSDSSSDSYFASSLMSRRHSTHQSAADLADVIVAGPNKLPLVTEGTFNIEVILQAKNAMEDHFGSKSTKPEDQVKQIYGCFQGVLPRTWINANKENLNGKTLDNFFDAFKRQHLPTDWDVYSSLHHRLETKNAFLVGSDHHHDDGAIISILENGMLVELADRVELADPPLVKMTLKIWEERVVKLDAERLAQLQLINQTIAQIEKNNKRPANTSQTYPNQCPFATSSQNMNNNFSRTNSNTNTASSTASSSTNSSFPAHACTYTTASNKTHSVVYANGKFEPLTDHDKDNLNTWKGCRKCRQILVDHKADNCPNGFADPMTYHVLTNEYCEATKRRHDADGAYKNSALFSYQTGQFGISLTAGTLMER
ncbi:hypothetical protein C8J56DRAFT_902710 [Mycena floridula]|nr:hypothetical protein C8J56DRAFT_902710 [Mycena floridula]